jgi:ORF6N domain
MSCTVLSSEGIERQILTLRGHRVMLGAHLAVLYGVDTRTLNQAVRRNLDRFPEDFMFQLTWEEAAALRSQFVILNTPADSKLESQSVSLKRGAHLKYRPSAFTEQGVAMLSTVLRSKQAVQVNIEVMRAFVRLRGLLTANRELARKFNELERKLSSHDQAIAGILDAIRQLMTPPELPKKRRIGFVQNE